jgi:very-short-patch-repair endonuclease
MAEDLSEVARKLRKNQTEAEKKLWSKLRREKLKGVKFRRQQPIGDYIVDFVTFEINLVIEVDGGQHQENEEDELRDEWLKQEGFSVLRFWNNDVLHNTDGVLKKIRGKIENLDKQ